jgi:hypothetical protein
VSELDPKPAGQLLKDIPISADIDILFVIDDSGSTGDKQTVFLQNFPNFITALTKFPDGLPNVHIGVTTSSVDVVTSNDTSCHPAAGLNGLLQRTDVGNTCNPITTADHWLVDIASTPGGPRMPNYSGTLSTAFSCIANRGSNGCGYEHQLEGMKRALDGTHPENNGFIRPGAYLAVIQLTDEDDCSAVDNSLFGSPSPVGSSSDFRCYIAEQTCDTPITEGTPTTYTGCKLNYTGFFHDPQEYSKFLVDLKGDPALVVVAAIMGDPSPVTNGTFSISTGQEGGEFTELKTCDATINGNPAVARPGNRIQRFLDFFGGHGLFRTVCQSDYTSALTDIGTLIFNAVTPCLEGPVDPTDISPDPGLQINCQVSDTQFYNTASQTDTPMDRCPMDASNNPLPTGPRPCWYANIDPVKCASVPTHLQLNVVRTQQPPPNTHVRASCVSN